MLSLTEETTGFENSFNSDYQFDQLYPTSIRLLARRHWTPLGVARKAAEFLAAAPGARILDIGSGVGKFCLAAAHHQQKAFFYGIEQRRTLIDHAESAKEKLGLQNIHFIHGNFMQLNFSNYDHFYFFNSFYENLTETDKIDNTLQYSGELYNQYNRCLYKQLDQKPAGTRIAAYHGFGNEIPPEYHLAGIEMDGLLKLWLKI